MPCSPRPGPRSRPGTPKRRPDPGTADGGHGRRGKGSRRRCIHPPDPFGPGHTGHNRRRGKTPRPVLLRPTRTPMTSVASPRSPAPVARLSSFYFFYYAALGAFTPYWSLYLQSRGMGVTAISVMMSLWYATRVIARRTWTSLAALWPRPIRWLRIGCVLTVVSFAGFLPPQPQWMLYAVMVGFCFFYTAVAVAAQVGEGDRQPPLR